MKYNCQILALKHNWLGIIVADTKLQPGLQLTLQNQRYCHYYFTQSSAVPLIKPTIGKRFGCVMLVVANAAVNRLPQAGMMSRLQRSG